MPCACIKKREFDLNVSHKGCEFLVINDQSTWSGIEVPDFFNVTIKIVSRDSEVTLPISTKGATTLSSKQLLNTIDQKCLPDDIYCFTTKSCGYPLKINRAYLCGLETRLNDLVSKYAETMDAEQRKLIFTLRMQIDSIKINAEKGNLELAKKLFKIVKDKLNAYHCDNC